MSVAGSEVVCGMLRVLFMKMSPFKRNVKAVVAPSFLVVWHWHETTLFKFVNMRLFCTVGLHCKMLWGGGLRFAACTAISCKCECPLRCSWSILCVHKVSTKVSKKPLIFTRMLMSHWRPMKVSLRFFMYDEVGLQQTLYNFHIIASMQFTQLLSHHLRSSYRPRC